MRSTTTWTGLLLAACLMVALGAPAVLGGPAAARAAEIAPVPADEDPPAPLHPVDAAAPEPGQRPGTGEDPEAPRDTAEEPAAPGAEDAGIEAAAGDAAGEEAEEPESDPVAHFYLSRCAGCHTIGEGELSGPDLKPSTGWPRQDLAKAVERMEKNAGPMTDEQVAELVALLKDEDVKQRLAAARERRTREMAATLEPPSPSRGRALFHGDERFRNGGLPCAACHRAGGRGGSLASVLTDAGERLGEQALMSAAETPGFPLMKAAYQDHPVTRQEAVHLTAYLVELEPSETAGAGTTSAGVVARVGWWGTGAAVAFLIAMLFLYRGRVRGVRAPLVREATQR